MKSPQICGLSEFEDESSNPWPELTTNEPRVVHSVTSQREN